MVSRGPGPQIDHYSMMKVGFQSMSATEIYAPSGASASKLAVAVLGIPAVVVVLSAVLLNWGR